MKGVTKYCENCHKEVKAKIEREEVKYTIANSQIIIECDVPRCLECGEELNDNDLFEKNSKIARDKYIEEFDILSIQEIKDILNKYDIGATILSKVLEWGDITITRYLNGKLPSKAYSDKLREINNNPQILLSLVEKNKKEITSIAYNKCKNKINSLDEISMTKTDKDSEININDIAKYIINKLEITPLALQKTLYFIQGFSIAFNNKFIFNDIPCAWIHGPVYPKVYRKYKSFAYNPIDENLNESIILNSNDKQLIDSIIKYLSLYNGTILEKITHMETPWINARKGLKPNEPSEEPIKLDDIEDYFKRVKDKYKMLSYLDISSYATYMANKVI